MMSSFPIIGYIYKIVPADDTLADPLWISWTEDVGKTWARMHTTEKQTPIMRYIRQMGGIDNFTMKLLLSGPFNDRIELQRVCEEFISKHRPPFNVVQPTKTKKPVCTKSDSGFVICSCGTRLRPGSMSQHLKTAKHARLLDIREAERKIQNMRL